MTITLTLTELPSADTPDSVEVCTDEQAMRDFEAFVEMSLDPQGRERLAAHAHDCAPCSRALGMISCATAYSDLLRMGRIA